MLNIDNLNMKGSNIMRGKLIVIEGTDCSGKETQTNLIIERLKNENINIEKFSYPNYDSPVGKIIGGPYLGKKSISESWFPEGAVNVDPKVASLFYAADRYYNKRDIEDLLNSGVSVIIDRYTYSNMAHQASKIYDKDERYKMYEWLEKLEFDFLELIRPDILVLLYMPYEQGEKLRQNRDEPLDEHEKSKEHILNSLDAYLEIAEKYGFRIINCSKDDNVRLIEDINDELFVYIKENL